MELQDRRETYNGFAEAYTRAFEFALAPVIFGAAGYLLDRWLGLVPVFTIALLLLGLVGAFARMWLAYETRMRAHEARGPWAPRP